MFRFEGIHEIVIFTMNDCLSVFVNFFKIWFGPTDSNCINTNRLQYKTTKFNQTTQFIEILVFLPCFKTNLHKNLLYEFSGRVGGMRMVLLLTLEVLSRSRTQTFASATRYSKLNYQKHMKINHKS